MTARGFTLFEMLVVLVVLGLLLSIVTPRIGDGGQALEARAATRQIAASLRQARSDAVLTNRAVRFTLDTDKNRYAIGPEGEWRNLPRSVAFEIETARSEITDEAVAAVRFFPDGSATGGRVTVRSEAGAYHVMLDWLTGSVTILD